MRARIAAVGLCVALVTITGALPVMALAPHENLDTAPLVFDGVALLQKYSQALDNVLGTNATAVEQLQEQAAPANIPPEIRNTVDNFLSSGYALAGLIPLVETDLENSKTMLAQYRVDDAMQSLAAARDKLNQAYSGLLVMERAASDTGLWWRVASARPGSTLSQAYEEVQAKLLSLSQLLDLLDNMDISLTRQVETINATSGQVLRPTIMGLSVEPGTAFVGDKVKFRGVLTAEGKPLVGRIVTILLDHTPVLSKLTDSDGVYQGEIDLPYRYIPEMKAQALYYPVGNDIGQYLGSSSPVVPIKVLYYETTLDIEANTTHPGRNLLLTGSFNYGNNPVAEARSLSIYWDGELAAESAVAANFSLELPVSANTNPGKHQLKLYVAPLGRYAPVQSAAEVEVTKISPSIEVNAPGIVLLPFTQDIRGKVSSSLGPLQDAGLEITLGDWTVSTRTMNDGTFHARLATGMRLTLLGNQDLRVTVTPAEPWYKAETRTVRLLLINPANIAGILLIVILPALFGVFRLRRRVTPAASMPVPDLVPALVGRESPPRPELLAPAAKGDPRTVLLTLYRNILRLVQEATAVILLPCQTLREFARESAPKLGVLGGYFQEFTLMIERLLYSRHRSTEADTTRARELSQRLMKGVKNEGT